MSQLLDNRKKDRIAITNLKIRIAGKTYKVVNINEFGVGFLVNSLEAVKIGKMISGIVIEGERSVIVAGIPRHLSLVSDQTLNLKFKPGWVCGTEFTTTHDIESGKILAAFISEHIKNEE